VVRSAFVHEGAARRLVHHLKYRGLAGAASLIAGAMAVLLDPGSAALVPVPRVLARLWHHGVDPAGELADALARRTGLPVVRRLARPLWWPRRAGPAEAARGDPRFRATGSPPPGSVLVDDVLTSGATLRAARSVLPAIRMAITATRAEHGVPSEPRPPR
jgi:predicted amidophosphoribosyltransferase